MFCTQIYNFFTYAFYSVDGYHSLDNMGDFWLNMNVTAIYIE